MKSLFSRLFGARSQSRRSANKPIRRNTPLGVEILDQRILMSVTPTRSLASSPS